MLDCTPQTLKFFRRLAAFINSWAISNDNSKMQCLQAETEYHEFNHLYQGSKSIIDEIDRVLARHYGFTDEELDFIINYDIKYRMGDELETKQRMKANKRITA